MLKQLLIASFTMFSLVAAFADDTSNYKAQQDIPDRGCGCGKDKTKK
jgi:hypothetical protein